MSETRLNSLALLYSQKDIKVNVDSVIDRFAVCNNRWMKLVNIFKSDEKIWDKDEITISEIYLY